MKRSILTAIVLTALISQAWAGFSLIRFGGRDQSGVIVNNDKKCYATSSLFDTGSQVTNNHEGSGGGLVKDPETGEWLVVGAGQTMNNNTITDTTDISSAVELVKAKSAEMVKGDGNTVEGGDKTKAGPSINAALTGQGVSGASQKQPNATASFTKSQITSDGQPASQRYWS